MSRGYQGQLFLARFDLHLLLNLRVSPSALQLYGINEAEQAIFFGSTDLKSPKFGTYFVDGGKVVGVFLEGGSPEELAAIKKVAVERPSAPSDLAEQGLKFATSR